MGKLREGGVWLLGAGAEAGRHRSPLPATHPPLSSVAISKIGVKGRSSGRLSAAVSPDNLMHAPARLCAVSECPSVAG